MPTRAHMHTRTYPSELFRNKGECQHSTLIAGCGGSPRQGQEAAIKTAQEPVQGSRNQGADKSASWSQAKRMGWDYCPKTIAMIGGVVPY